MFGRSTTKSDQRRLDVARELFSHLGTLLQSRISVRLWDGSVIPLGEDTEAGLELSIREHFAGYRSHTLLLSGVAGAAVLAALFYLAPEDVPVVVRIVVAGIVFAGTARILSLLFQRRAGVLYKLR